MKNEFNEDIFHTKIQISVFSFKKNNVLVTPGPHSFLTLSHRTDWQLVLQGPCALGMKSAHTTPNRLPVSAAQCQRPFVRIKGRVAYVSVPTSLSKPVNGKTS